MEPCHDTRTVVRIESELGYGPYQGGGPRVDWPMLLPSGCTDRERRWPTLAQEGAPALTCLYEQHMRCGFADLDRLHIWFDTPELMALSDAGYMVASYELPTEDVCYESASQLIFDLTRARLIERVPIDSCALASA